MIPPVPADTPTPSPPASPAWRVLLENALTHRLFSVGFQRDALPKDFGEIVLPAEFSVWFSVYGFVLLYCVPPEAVAGLIPEETALALARKLANAARDKNRLWDAYVVLAFEAEPTGEAAERVRAFEQGRAVARRHVLWPGGDPAVEASWAGRMDRITCCAIPAAGAADGKLAPAFSDVPGWLAEIEAKLVARETDTEVLVWIEALAAADRPLVEEPTK